MADTISLTLELTADEWCELANAVGSKADLVENGDYGESDEDVDVKEWAEQLRQVYRKVGAVLEKNKVTY
jgi:hypothetical protein